MSIQHAIHFVCTCTCTLSAERVDKDEHVTVHSLTSFTDSSSITTPSITPDSSSHRQTHAKHKLKVSEPHFPSFLLHSLIPPYLPSSLTVYFHCPLTIFLLLLFCVCVCTYTNKCTCICVLYSLPPHPLLHTKCTSTTHRKKGLRPVKSHSWSVT